jgi:hypothetical protein
MKMLDAQAPSATQPFFWISIFHLSAGRGGGI